MNNISSVMHKDLAVMSQAGAKANLETFKKVLKEKNPNKKSYKLKKIESNGNIKTIQSTHLNHLSDQPINLILEESESEEISEHKLKVNLRNRLNKLHSYFLKKGHI